MRHKEVEDFIDRFLKHCHDILEQDNIHCIYLVGIDINSRSGEAGALQYFDYLINQIYSDATIKCDVITQVSNYHGWGSYWFPKPNIQMINFGVTVPESLNIKQKMESNCVRVVIKLTRNYIPC